MESSKFFIDII